MLLLKVFPTLNFLFDHIDIDFVENVRKVLGLTETEARNINVLEKTRKIINLNIKEEKLKFLTSAPPPDDDAEPSKCPYN